MYYVLEGETVRQVDREECFSRLRNTARIQVDKLGDYAISSIFLGIDHAYGEAEPMLFETMVFHSDTGTLDIWQARSTSLAGIKQEHLRAIEWVLNQEK